MSDNLSLAMMIFEQQFELLSEGNRATFIEWLQDNYIRTSSREKFEKSIGPDPEYLNEDQYIESVAYIDDDGKFRIIIKDLKAKSAIDAAIRAHYVIIKAYCDLSDNEEVSSRNVLVPFLRKYGLYTGSNRSAIKHDEHILRNGDLLSLDQEGVAQAEKYIQDIQDPDLTGRWNLVPKPVLLDPDKAG